jgi:transcriptional regulator with XRE-family HTH domain
VFGDLSAGGPLQTLSLDIGRELRRARFLRGWTLKEVERRSQGRFKASSVGGYERGERSISTTSFCQLAMLYGQLPHQLLAQVFEYPGTVAGGGFVIDLTRLGEVRSAEREAVMSFVGGVRVRRQGGPSDRIALRAGDLALVADMAGDDPETFLHRLGPALVAEAGGPK